MIGQRIKKERQRQNISQKALALEVGIKPPALSQIESGKRSLSLKVLLKITDALHITPNDILGRDISVTSNNTNYNIYLSKDDLHIIKEIQKYNQLYQILASDRGDENIALWAKKQH